MPKMIITLVNTMTNNQKLRTTNSKKQSQTNPILTCCKGVQTQTKPNLPACLAGKFALSLSKGLLKIVPPVLECRYRGSVVERPGEFALQKRRNCLQFLTNVRVINRKIQFCFPVAVGARQNHRSQRLRRYARSPQGPFGGGRQLQRRKAILQGRYRGGNRGRGDKKPPSGPGPD
jgi:hypothetical protein